MTELLDAALATNEAAERLRAVGSESPSFLADLDAALAAERKATVERIRAAIDADAVKFLNWEDHIDAILDAEAGDRLAVRPAMPEDYPDTDEGMRQFLADAEAAREERG